MTKGKLRIFGVCGIVSAVLLTVTYVVGDILRPGFSSMSQAISELIEAGAPNKTLLDIMIFFFHGLVVPFAYGLHKGINDRKGSKLGPWLLAGAGVLGLVITAFSPSDPGCKPVTLRGILHIFIAVPMGFMILFAILAFSRRMKKTENWKQYSTYSLITFIAGFLLGVLAVVFAKSSVGGLIERLISASYQQWYVVMGVILIRRDL
jgi:uncharacterized membrane protein